MSYIGNGTTKAKKNVRIDIARFASKVMRRGRGFYLTTREAKDIKAGIDMGAITKATHITVVNDNRRPCETAGIKRELNKLGLRNGVYEGDILDMKKDALLGFRHFINAGPYDFANLDTCNQFSVPLLYAIMACKAKKLAITVQSGRHLLHKSILKKLFYSGAALRRLRKTMDCRREHGNGVLKEMASIAAGIEAACGAWPKAISYAGGRRDVAHRPTMLTFLVTPVRNKSKRSKVMAACDLYDAHVKMPKAMKQDELRLSLNGAEQAHRTMLVKKSKYAVNAVARWNRRRAREDQHGNLPA